MREKLLLLRLRRIANLTKKINKLMDKEAKRALKDKKD